MRDSIKNSVLNTVRDLHRSGAVDQITLREIETLCKVHEVKTFSSKSIIKLRKNKLHLSQGAFARVLNISISTVQKWEIGAKKPSGLALKLLNIADEKGLEGIL